MSRHTINTPFHAGDLISERAARRVTAHRRAATSRDPAGAAGARENPAPTAAKPTSSHAGGPRILRRWSVAELIARAAAGPPVVA